MNSEVSVPLLYANLSYDTFRVYNDKFEKLETKLRSFMDDLHRVRGQILRNSFSQIIKMKNF